MKLGLYQPYKGPFYQVIGIGRHSETLEKFVIYQMLHEKILRRARTAIGVIAQCLRKKSGMVVCGIVLWLTTIINLCRS